jgi:hypothetical protein
MVTRFSTSEKAVLGGAVQLVKEADMKFTITHPMHSHPYNPELVTGPGIAAVAAAAEAAGFDGFGFTDLPLSGGWNQVDTTRWTRSWQWDSPPPTRRRCG